MLDRFKRRFFSIIKQKRGLETVINDDNLYISKLSFRSSSPPTTVDVDVDDEEQGGDAQVPPNTTDLETLVTTTGQLTARPDNSLSRLFSLPAELLLHLQRSLTPCTEVSLRQSCSRFLHIYSYPSFNLTGDDRFTFLCHLERDNPHPSRNRTKFVCGHCRGLHTKSAFPSSELRRLPQQRDCRQVWLCPHRALGFAKVVQRIRAVETLFRVENLDPCVKCKPLLRHRSVADRPGKSSYTPASEVDLSDSSIAGETLLISKIGILQQPSPSSTRVSSSSLHTEVFPTRELAAALSGLDFRICPHIRLGDPYILSKFCRSCLHATIVRPGEKGPPCISLNNNGQKRGKCRGDCYVKGCKTSFMFQTRESLLPDISGRRQIWLILGIYRWLGPLIVEKETIEEKANAERAETIFAIARAQEGRLLVDHTVDAAQMVEMRVNWKTWLRDHGRKCMPDWSICRLHPEDCNLR
jgi:hypothetical protein